MALAERFSNERDVARCNMIDCQLRPNGITQENLLQAFGSVCREAFIPAGVRPLAYSDADIPLHPDASVACPRWLLSPLTFGKMLQVAAIQPLDTVLMVGCGTGYGPAIAAFLAASVTGLEDQPVWAALADAFLKEQGMANTQLETGALSAGCPERGPYDVIILEGAVAHIPASLTHQLGEGGRLVAVRKERGRCGKGTVIVKQGNHLSEAEMFDANCPYLPGFEPVTGFGL